MIQRRFLTSTQTSLDLLKGLVSKNLTPPDSAGLDLSVYRDNPVGFGVDILGETFTDDVAELMNSVRDNVVTIGKSANATGKTHAAARLAIWFYKVHLQSRVYCAAAPPEDNLRNLLWAEVDACVHRNPQLFAFDRVTDLRIARTKQSFITGVTIPVSGRPKEREARFSGKHAPQMLFIIDEGDAVPNEVYTGIESCISGGQIVRVVILVNPRREAGPVYQKERDGEANVVVLSAFNHPNVATGDDSKFPGAVTRETTVRRINKWSRPIVDGERVQDAEAFEVPPELAGYVAHNESGKPYPPLAPGRRKITSPELSYMVLARYPSQAADQLISTTEINAARSRFDLYQAEYGDAPPEAVYPTQGLDVAELGGDQNASCLRYGDYVAPLEAWSGVNLPETERRAAELHRRKRCAVTFVDGTGVGAGVAPHINEILDEFYAPPRKRPAGDEGAYSVKVAESPEANVEEGEFEQKRDELYWRMRLWFKTGNAMIPPNERLVQALRIPTYSKTARRMRIKIMDKPTMIELLGYSPDEMESLMLTFYNDRVEQEAANGPLARVLKRRF